MSLKQTLVFIMTLFGYSFGNQHAELYSWYADVCNVETSAQFCDVVYRRCRNCEDVRNDCFSRMMTFNCTDYCYEVKHGHDIEQLRVSGCNISSPPEHGRYHVNTTRVSYNTTLIVTCDTGYSLLDGDQYLCNNFSVRTGTKPICKVSELCSAIPTAAVWTVMAIIILIVIFIGLYIVYKRSKLYMKLQNTYKHNKHCETNNANGDQNLTTSDQPYQMTVCVSLNT